MNHSVKVNNLGLHNALTDPMRSITPELKVSNNVLQRADVVWSKMELKEDEVLFIKVSLGAAANIESISDMIDAAFGRRRHQVLVFLDGTLEITKSTRAEVCYEKT